MPNWNSIEETYIYDGTFDGFLTIVFDCYVAKAIPRNIVKEQQYAINLLETYQYQKTDLEKSQRVFDGISKNICEEALYMAYQAFLCREENKEIVILKFLLAGFTVGPGIVNMLTLDYVLEMVKLKRKVFGEAHRLKGLLRFIEIGDNLYYASIHPDNNVIEEVGNHFVYRLATSNFIIHDKIRNLAFLYNQKEYTIIDVADIPLPKLSEQEKQYQKLWKTFYNTIAIKERTNPRLQKQYMPKRYWIDLIEKN